MPTPAQALKNAIEAATIAALRDGLKVDDVVQTISDVAQQIESAAPMIQAAVDALRSPR